MINTGWCRMIVHLVMNSFIGSIFDCQHIKLLYDKKTCSAQKCFYACTSTFY
jgi:hypothetical protein